MRTGNILKRILIVLLLAIVGCTSEPARDAGNENTAASDTATDAEKVLVVPWRVEINDSTQMMEIRRDPAANSHNLNVQDIVDALNNKYPAIKLEWDRRSNDTAYVSIDDASQLTQRSGSLGAQAYLAEVTYSLTEIPEVGTVTFSFAEGDHASPGSYDRGDFGGQ